jgi:hypothetical protein
MKDRLGLCNTSAVAVAINISSKEQRFSETGHAIFAIAVSKSNSHIVKNYLSSFEGDASAIIFVS